MVQILPTHIRAFGLIGAQRAGGYSDDQFTTFPANWRRDVFAWFLMRASRA